MVYMRPPPTSLSVWHLSQEFDAGSPTTYSSERRAQDLAAGRTGKEATGVTAKREHILEMPLAAYQTWADPLTKGFEQAERFLRSEGFHHPKFLPYRTQLTPLAALLARLGERWLEPQIKQKLARWFWSGVFGELYGGRHRDAYRPRCPAGRGVDRRQFCAGACYRAGGGLQPEPPRHASVTHERGLPRPLRAAPARGGV